LTKVCLERDKLLVNERREVKILPALLFFAGPTTDESLVGAIDPIARAVRVNCPYLSIIKPQITRMVDVEAFDSLAPAHSPIRLPV